MKFIQKYVHWLPVVIWMGLIFYLSHQPAEQSSELSSGVVEMLLRILLVVFPIDGESTYLHFLVRKAAHFFAYFMLSIFVMYAIRSLVTNLLKSTFLSLLICILYAISDEIHQLYIPGRSGEVRDVLIDSAGSLSGLILYFIIVTCTITRRKRN